jgi:protein-tyrosine phosphatase
VQEKKNGLYRLKWGSANTHTVEVYGADNPSDFESPRYIGRAGPHGDLTVQLPYRVRWYFKFVPDGGQALVLAERSLHLSSASNFRDIGGYRTQDGRWVRMGLAYRSNGLAELSDADSVRVESLGLKLICDLRLEQERFRLPDAEIAGAYPIWADVAADSAHQSSALSALLDSGDRSAVTNFIKGAYRDFVDLPSAQIAYRRLLELLADPENLPMLFHCTAGKDRTGWAQAILLSILNVPRSTIIQDYVLTDRYLSSSAMDQIRKSMPAVDEKMVQVLVAADPRFLVTAFREVDERYGSFDGYLKLGLHIDERTIRQLRSIFLQ